MLEQADPDRWRLVTFDARRRAPVGSPIPFTAPAERVCDAATSGGRVVVAIGGRLWLIADGAARVVADAVEPAALWVDATTVGWLEKGVPKSVPAS